MKKNMVLKDNIVAIEIKRFTRASSRGSSEQKIIGAKRVFVFQHFFWLILFFES